MKIVFLADDFPPQSFGGAGISTYELARGMQEAGHDVFVITTCRKQVNAGESTYHGLTVYRIQSDYPKRWRAYLSLYNPQIIRSLTAILKDLQADVVHVNNIHFYLSYHSLKVAKKYARTVIFTARDVMLFNYGKLETERYLREGDYRTSWRDHVRQAGKRWNPFRNFLIKRYLSYVDHLCTVSEALRDALLQNGVKDAQVIHTGIDVADWECDPNAVHDLKERYDLLGKPVIFFGGRLSRSKGGLAAIKAFSQVVKALPQARMLVVGKADGYIVEMIEQSSLRDIADQIVYTGWMEREGVKNAYGAADVVWVPSFCFDSFPRTVLEGMASSKPVIGTYYGGAQEAIDNGGTGYLINPQNTEEMSRKTLELLKDPNKAKSFGERGRKRIEKELNLKRSVEAYIALYNKNIAKD